MFSFATRPVTEAVAACQVPKPSGRNRNANGIPILASIEYSSSSSASIRKEPSTTPKKERNQITMVESRMMVPAFLMNDQPRSHIERSTLPTVGRW